MRFILCFQNLDQIINQINNRLLKAMDNQEYNSQDQKQSYMSTSQNLGNQDAYVAQFLNIYYPIKNVMEDIQSQKHIFENQKIKSRPDKNKQFPEKNQKKKSLFHNFQKHFVAAMKALIQMDMFPKYENQQFSDCQQALWLCFCGSPKQNKTLFYTLIGNLNQISKNHVELYGFKQVIKNFEPHVISSVQEELKKNIIEQIKSKDLNKIIVHRRIKYKKQFVIYFGLLVKELKEGDLSKRITGLHKIIRKIKSQEEQQDNSDQI